MSLLFLVFCLILKGNMSSMPAENPYYLIYNYQSRASAEWNNYKNATMFSRLRCFKASVLPPVLTLFQQSPDHVEPTSKSAVALAEVEQKLRAEESGWARLYNMFSTDEFGEPSPEMTSVLQVVMLSIVVGGGIGGFVQSKVSFLNFVENNDATKFTHHLEAKQKLQDRVTLGFAKGAWRWGWRLTAFTGSYSTISTAISVYRGKSGILEHTAAGMVTGAAYKMNLGIRGIVVGGTLGGVLGSLAGLSIWGMLAMSGRTMDDVRQSSVWFKNKRESYFKQAINEHIQSQDPQIAHEHDARIGQRNLDLSNIKLEEKPTQKG